MATYLLKAPDEDMKRWKQDARDHGLSFAAFVRMRLDSSGKADKVQAQIEAGVIPDGQLSAGPMQNEARPEDRRDKRSYEPDPK